MTLPQLDERQWHLPVTEGEDTDIHINVWPAWQRGANGEGVRVAVIDTGFDLGHPAFHMTGPGGETAARIALDEGASFDVYHEGFAVGAGAELPSLEIDQIGSGISAGDALDKLAKGELQLPMRYGTGESEDQARRAVALLNRFNAHGTACASLVAGNLGSGCVGIAYRATIVPIRVSTNFDVRSWISILLLAGASADVVLLPRSLPRIVDPDDAEVDAAVFGGVGVDQTDVERLRAVVDAVAKRRPLIAAVGNSGSARLAYPARLPSVIAVGALNHKGYRSSFSNYGEGLDLVAPSNDMPGRDRNFDRSTKGDAPGTMALSSRLGLKSIFAADYRGLYGYDRRTSESDAGPGSYCDPDSATGFGGTSAAAAIAAGSAAVVVQALKAAGTESPTGAEVLDALRSTANMDACLSDPDEWSPGRSPTRQAEFGKGLINLGHAISEVLPTSP